MSSVTVDRLDEIRNILLGDDPRITPTLYSANDHTPNTDRTVATTRSRVGTDGSLTSLQVQIISGTPNRNLYVRATLEDENQVDRAILFRGYCDVGSEANGAGTIPVRYNWKIRLDSYCSMSVAPVIRLKGTLLSTKLQAGGWNGTQEAPLDGRGSLRSVVGTNPGATVDVNEEIPTGAFWRMQSMRFSVIGGAAQADPSWIINDNDDVLKWDSLVPAIAANATRNLLLERNGFEPAFSVGYDGRGNFRTRFPEVDLGAGYSVGTEDIGSADSAAPQLIVEEWLTA